MYHKQRWTPGKINRRLELIEPLAHVKRKSLPSFRYHELENALTLPQTGMDVDDSNWQELHANEYWGSWMQNFVLRTTFTIPEDWDQTQPTALHLPLGEAGDFSHPEALAYIDGLLEENESELSVKHDSISLNLRPYQIMRLRLKPK